MRNNIKKNGCEMQIEPLCAEKCEKMACDDVFSAGELTLLASEYIKNQYILFNAFTFCIQRDYK